MATQAFDRRLDEDRFYRPDDVAKLFKVTRRTVYGYIDSGQLRATRVGPRIIRIERSDLEDFIRSGKEEKWPAAM